MPFTNQNIDICSIEQLFFSSSRRAALPRSQATIISRSIDRSRSLLCQQSTLCGGKCCWLFLVPFNSALRALLFLSWFQASRFGLTCPDTYSFIFARRGSNDVNQPLPITHKLRSRESDHVPEGKQPLRHSLLFSIRVPRSVLVL